MQSRSMHREPNHDSPQESEPDRDNLRDRGLPFLLVAHLLVLDALYPLKTRTTDRAIVTEMCIA
jgi:hypothetical protein